MANIKNEKNGDKSLENKLPTAAVDFDFADFLPAGFDKEGLKDTGGLTPLYGAKEAFENKLPPVAGKIDRLIRLPAVLKGKEWYIPHAILVRELVKPTKALQGTKENKKLVEVPAGGDILLPLTGNLEYNRELIRALNDNQNVHFGIFACVGQQQVNNQITPMWVWKVQIHDKKVPRVDVFALPFEEHARLVALPTGQFYDIETGEVLERGQVATPVASNSRQLPA